MGKIGAFVVKEIRNAMPAMIFFLWLFHMIALTKAVLVEDYSITALRAVVATVAAIIVAKAILIVESLPIARLFSGKLMLNVLWKTLLFGVVAILIRFIEEIIPLISKHEGLVATTAHFYREIHWPQFWVFQLWFFSGLLLFCFASDVARTVGVDRIKEIIFGSKSKPSDR
jgi:hypothetical protein